MRFEILKSKNREGRVHFQWRMKSLNNTLLATSKIYDTKFNARRIVRMLMQALGEDVCTYKFTDTTKKGK